MCKGTEAFKCIGKPRRLEDFREHIRQGVPTKRPIHGG